MNNINNKIDENDIEKIELLNTNSSKNEDTGAGWWTIIFYPIANLVAALIAFVIGHFFGVEYNSYSNYVLVNNRTGIVSQISDGVNFGAHLITYLIASAVASLLVYVIFREKGHSFKYFISLLIGNAISFAIWFLIIIL